MASASPPTPTLPHYFLGNVTAVQEQTRIQSDDGVYYTQDVQVTKQQSAEQFTIHVGSEFQPITEAQLLKVGTPVVLAQQVQGDGQLQTVIADAYRLPTLAWLTGGFVVLVIWISRWQGARALLGMLLSLGILLGWIIPQILAGQNPVLVSLAGAVVIAVLTVYLSHGVSWHAHLALASMSLTLAAVALLSWVAVRTAYFVGLGQEEAAYLQYGVSRVNLQGLLLGGMMLSALGILDDIAIAQVSVVLQLKQVKQELSLGELYQRGLQVGKDHVASLTNTLILAYTAANLPLFLLFLLNQSAPAWVTLNSEVMAEEVLRTVVGSIGLVLAVPLATLAASVVAHYRPSWVLAEYGDHTHHNHSHGNSRPKGHHHG